jgi:hypothetical protein
MKEYIGTLKVFLLRNEVRLIIVSTVTGGVLQILARRYLKSHPELLKNVDVPKRKYRFPLLPRGGAFLEVYGVNIREIAQIVIKFLAENGLLAGLLGGTGAAISQIPTKQLAKSLDNSMPQNLAGLEKKKLIIINGKTIYLDMCDQAYEYLFKILEDPEIPFEEKQKFTAAVLNNFTSDLKPMLRRVSFVICMVVLLYILSQRSTSGFYVLLSNLIQAIKDGRISKNVAKTIVRRLRRKGVPVDPELLELVK